MKYIEGKGSYHYLANKYNISWKTIETWVRKSTPADNAPIESFHANSKRETLYSYNITSLKEYIDLVKEWITFYNTDRIRLL
ncbi:MAG: integrase core domain-containing protein [Bacilli bacterium]